jgi:Lar family restriction alleviation protein
MSLKPCPFCGAQALLAEYQGKLGYDEFFSLGCSYDGCCAHEMFSHWKLEDGQRDEAIELWNARAPQPEELAKYWCGVAEAKQREINRKQAVIDRLMLEYCPEEMTKAQIEEWREHQVSVSPEQEAAVQRALSSNMNNESATK